MYTASKPIEIIFNDQDENERNLFSEAVEHIGIPVKLTSFENCGSLTDFLDKLEGPIPPPDVIFMDIAMIGRKGLCLREIRENTRYTKIPIIIFASSLRPIDIKESRRFGANLYINKPTGLKELIDLLKKIFSPQWHEMLMH